MESIPHSLKSFLPKQAKKIYKPVGQCIYCGSTSNLTTEHIIPFGLGGRLELPEASCLECCKVTSDFEHTCLRTMYGPLRLLYDLPSRRRKNRPDTLSLKVKKRPNDEWSYIEVPQEKFPFLILFPYLSYPKILDGSFDVDCRGAKAKTFWIRGASPSYRFDDLLENLVHELKVHTIMPEAKAEVDKFCRMIAKIGYSFAVRELGINTFVPFLLPHILDGKLDDTDNFVGASNQTEKASNKLHELSMVLNEVNALVIVRLRLLAKLETPAYYIVVGKRKQEC